MEEGFFKKQQLLRNGGLENNEVYFEKSSPVQLVLVFYCGHCSNAWDLQVMSSVC